LIGGIFGINTLALQAFTGIAAAGEFFLAPECIFGTGDIAANAATACEARAKVFKADVGEALAGHVRHTSSVRNLLARRGTRGEAKKNSA